MRPAASFETLGHKDLLARLDMEYKIMEMLGSGSSAVVRRAVRKSDGQELCVKMVRTDEKELVEITRQEVELLKTLRHPNIIRGYDFVAGPTGVAIVLEYFPGTTLQRAVRRAAGRRLDEEVARGLFAALISAVAHLHANGIVHRDVKADNVLVSGDLTDLRLIDFNTAQRVEDGGALTMTGTRDWSAPEVLRGDSPGMPQDVWGAGLCLYSMLFGRLPQRAERYKSQEDYAVGTLKTIASALGGGGAGQCGPSNLCEKVLRACLEEEPSKRTSAPAVTDAAWLK